MSMPFKDELRYAQVIGLPLLAMALFYYLRTGIHAEFPPLMFKLISIPGAMLMWWVFMAKRDYGRLHFSPLFFALFIGFSGLLFFKHHDLTLRWVGILGGMFAGYFVWVDFRKCFSCMAEHKRPALVALIMGAASFCYIWANDLLWREIVHSTAIVLDFFMKLFDTSQSIGYNNKRMLMIQSPYMSLEIHHGCSGMEGVFLFAFLISGLLLLDWDIFKRRNLLNLYASGFLYMFMMNAFRIFYIFFIFDIASNPNAGTIGKMLQGWPQELAHSTAGWIFYLIAFGIFTWLLYAITMEERRNDTKREEGA